MSMCPICNGISSIEVNCSSCNVLFTDEGRLLDYIDDYSAYLEIEGMKLFDGISDDAKNKQCPHVLYCSQCHLKKKILIPEI